MGDTRSLADRREPTRMVLCLLPGIGNSFWNVVINAIEAVVIRAGYGIVFGDARGDPVREAHYDRMVRSGAFDGVILLNGRLPSPDFADLDSRFPIVLGWNDVPEAETLPVYDIADREAARSMTDLLIAAGHRRIAHITGNPSNVGARERVLGYRDALAAAGIAVDESLIWPGTFSYVAGAKGVERFLATADRPTAIFAASDEVAVGCIKGLKEAGLSVPADVSVAGFDGVDFSAMYDPALTTVIQPRAELGRLVAERLVQRMSDVPPATGERRTRLSCTLVLRESVGPVGSADVAALRAFVSGPAAAGRREAASR